MKLVLLPIFRATATVGWSRGLSRNSLGSGSAQLPGLPLSGQLSACTGLRVPSSRPHCIPAWGGVQGRKNALMLLQRVSLSTLHNQAHRGKRLGALACVFPISFLASLAFSLSHTHTRTYARTVLLIIYTWVSPGGCFIICCRLRETGKPNPLLFLNF